MLGYRSLYISSVLLLFVGSASAGEIADAGVTAEDLVSAGKYDEALQTLDAAKDAVWAQSPLTFRRTIFVASDPSGFGIYDIRESSEFKRSEPLIIYSEPVGFAYGRDGQLYITDMALDFEITDTSGASIAKQENFGSWTLRSRVPNKEFMGKLNYDFSGLQPGDYKVTTKVRDKNSNKSNSFSMSFKLVP